MTGLGLSSWISYEDAKTLFDDSGHHFYLYLIGFNLLLTYIKP